MKSNMSSTDRVGRAIFAVLVVLLYMMDIISGSVAIVLFVIATILVATSVISFCPIYTIFGINTKRRRT